MVRRWYTFTLAVFLVLTGFAAGAGRPATVEAAQIDQRPNFLLIITDDQRYGTMEYMPLTQQMIFERGVTFTSGFVTTPMCCPSRATIFTGQHTHAHHVYSNYEPLRGDTMVKGLHDSGYYTGIVGKFLNSWGRLPHYSDPLPEFDYWVAHGGQGGEGDYFHPTLMVDGKWVEHDEYTTYVVRDYALDFLAEAAQRDQPFFLVFAPYAPHAPATPALGDEALYSDLAPHRPPSFNPDGVPNLPPVLRADPLTQKDIDRVDAFRLDQLRSLKSVDEAIAALLDELDSAGKLDNTVIVFLSDNGVMWGEHGLSLSKDVLYEEAIHVPFAISYPALIDGPQTRNEMVANIDIAPTIYELAGLPIPSSMQGHSLVGLLHGDNPRSWRSHLLLEAYNYDGNELIYVGVQDARFQYIETLHQTESSVETVRLNLQWITLKTEWIELYDLETDPYQMHNLAGDPAYRKIEKRMKRLLWRDVSRNELSPRTTLKLGYYEWAALGGALLAGALGIAAIVWLTRWWVLRHAGQSGHGS